MKMQVFDFSTIIGMVFDIEAWCTWLRLALEPLISQIFFALFSFASLKALLQTFLEWRWTTKQLRKHVAKYIDMD